MYRTGLRIGVLFAALIVFSAGGALAQSPSVTAVLSNSEAVLGQMVQLQIKVTGGHNADAPKTIEADGLEINRTGEQYEVQSSFGFGRNETAGVRVAASDIGRKLLLSHGDLQRKEDSPFQMDSFHGVNPTAVR